MKPSEGAETEFDDAIAAAIADHPEAQPASPPH
jgi:hypothetical protein